MEPVRLRDLEDTDVALREDLSRVASEDVGYDVAAGAARFEAGLAAGLPLPADPASATSSVLVWLGIGAGVVGVAAIAWVVGRAPVVEAPAAKDDVVEPAPEEPPVVAETERARVVIPPPPVAVPEAAVVEPPPPVVVPRKIEKQPIAAPPESDDDRLKREMAATRAADKALAADPSRALELVRAADREFAGGMFAEDREGIEALAKLALGKGDADARKYLAAHPKGTFAQRVQKAIDAQGK